MSLPLTDADDELILTSVEHYNAYLIATRREDSRYQDLLDRLQRKPSASEQGDKPIKKKKA